MNSAKTFQRAALLAVIFLWPSARTWSDVIYLKDGRTLEGVVTDKGNYYVVQMGSIKTEVAKDRVLRIEQKTSPQEEYKQRLAKIAPNDADAFFELAAWCAERKLATEARECLAKTIQINPNHQGARLKLGHVMREGKWVKLCVKCTGTGKADCPACAGTGITRHPCPACAKGKKTCEACQGQGYLLCPNCKGAGGFVCAACGGTGGFWAQEGVWINGMYSVQPVWHQCPRCSGQGKLDCPNCVQGRIDCQQCKKGKYKCPTCDGKGYTRVPCTGCNGLRKTNCGLCDGKGFIQVDVPSVPSRLPEAVPPPRPLEPEQIE